MVTGRKDREDSSAFADGTEYMKKNLGSAMSQSDQIYKRLSNMIYNFTETLETSKCYYFHPSDI